MLKRVSEALLASSAMAAAAIVVGSSAMVPAQASVASVATHRATPMCAASSLNCYTPRLYGDVGSEMGQALEVRPSGTSLSNAPVVVAPYDSTSFLQDWTYIDYGTVSSYASSGGLGLTPFDFHNYPSASLYVVEFTPAGIPSGYCAANVSDRMQLRTCNGSAFQTYIVTQTVPGGLSTPSVTGQAWDYYLSLAQVSTTAHHYAATGSRISDTQVYFTTPRHTVNQWWGQQILV